MPWGMRQQMIKTSDWNLHHKKLPVVIICINEAGCINEPQNKCLQSLVVLLKAWCCHFTHINLPGAGTILNKCHLSSCLHLTLVHLSYGLRILCILIYQLICTLKLNPWRTSVTAVLYINSVWSQSVANLEENVAENTALTEGTVI